MATVTVYTNTEDNNEFDFENVTKVVKNNKEDDLNLYNGKLLLATFTKDSVLYWTCSEEGVEYQVIEDIS